MWLDSKGETHWLTEDELEEERRKDEETELLADKMVRKLYVDDAGDEVHLKRIERRGGHNKKVVERINHEGYVTGVWPSFKEAVKGLGMKYNCEIMNKRRGRPKEGMILRYRDNAKNNKK